MSDSKRETKWQQPWFLRRAAYAVVGVVLLVLAGAGVIEQGQIDAIEASPILGAIVAFIASSRTNAGSDSTVTVADVDRASAEARAQAQAQLEDVRQAIQSGVAEQVAAAVQHLPDSVRDRVESLYQQPYGRHDIEADAPHVIDQPAPETPDYIYGR